MESSPALLLLITLTFSFLVALTIYWIGGKLSVKSKTCSKEKTAPYACGERPPSMSDVGVNLERFFIFTVYFLIFDVFAFIIALSFSAVWYLPTIYSLVVLMAVLTFLVVRRRK